MIKNDFVIFRKYAWKKKSLGFGYMHENKIYFCIFWNFREELSIFNSRFVSYNISLQLNLR
jgi:hypothetical protein